MHESNFACAFMNIVPRMMEFVASTKSDFGEKTVTDAPTKDEQKKHDETSAGFSMGICCDFIPIYTYIFKLLLI